MARKENEGAEVIPILTTHLAKPSLSAVGPDNRLIRGGYIQFTDTGDGVRISFITRAQGEAIVASLRHTADGIERAIQEAGQHPLASLRHTADGIERAIQEMK